MRTYIINLSTDKDRREYMENVIQQNTPFLDVNWINAVNGFF